jgi:O-6-methylguanine DNA methyltransferase
MKKLENLAGWDKLTPFQQAVLTVVYQIPRGQVRTYAQVAKMTAKLGHEPRYARASRAVGSVMKLNPYAPLVPCHRVVRSDGTFGNYSGKGGMAGKRAMLKKEGAVRYR